MRLIDLYYQAFRAFRKHTQNDTNSQKLRHIIAQSNAQKDRLTSVKFTADIEADWITNIEEGLIYVEKAIREDRQFIRTQGEVVQIEKVKRVSKASVEHLSKHSDLITRAPKDGNPENIIPDKLYVVEKLSDYLVYENRFLYLLLSYLKDFIQMRLDKIKDKTTTYESTMVMDKKIKANQRSINFQMDYNEVSKNDPLLVDNYKDIPLVNRVETIYAMVVSFLATPLMKEVSKAPKIKPPVVKTNVLRMNPNFRAALKLYDYVTSYSKDGYSFREIKKTFSPFPASMGDEIADTIELSSVIAYITGNDIESTLLERLEAKEKEQLILANQKAVEEIRRLKKRIIEMNEDPAEYILKLEKRNVHLEKENVHLAEIKAQNAQLLIELDIHEKEKLVFMREKEELKTIIEEKINEVDLLNQKYFDDMTTAEEIHQQEISTLNQKHHDQIQTMMEHHEQAIASLNETHQKAIEQLNASHQLAVDTLQKDHNQTLLDLKKSHESNIEKIKLDHEQQTDVLITAHQVEVTKLDEHINELHQQVSKLEDHIRLLKDTLVNESNAYETTVNDLNQKLKRMTDEKQYVSAQFLAFKAQQGLLTEEDDYTSKERFKQLEQEMIAYKKLFKEQWKKTKEKIRTQVKQEMPIVEEKHVSDTEEHAED